MQHIHLYLPGASFEKPDSIVTESICSSGYYPTDACRAAEGNKVYTDYFVSGSYLCPTDDKPCPVHVAPTPTPVPTLPPPGPGQDPNQGQQPGQPAPV